MCIYWCIVDWPQHVLHRSFAWPVFSILRSKIINGIEGGLGRIMRMVLRTFFPEVGHSFATGVHIHCPTGGYVVTAIFAGFLADLLGHKELSAAKGTGGISCCINCANVVNCQHRASKVGEVTCACSDRRNFRQRTNDDVWAIVDALAEVHGTISKTKFESLETEYGFNYSPEGILLDKGIRHIYKPVDQCIRVWQHTVAQDGVGNTHIFNVVMAMTEMCNIPIEMIQNFSQLCNYPSMWGKLDQAAFARQRLRNTTIASFSSTILTMVPVLYLFMEKFVADAMPRHFAAFKLLHNIFGILRMSPKDATRHTSTLRTLIAEHLAACVDLYGDYVKPKAHHMFHIVDGILWLGCLLGCFVTERKHRVIKAASLHVFRHIEHTVLHDVLNQNIQQILDGNDLYNEQFLVCPSIGEVGSDISEEQGHAS